MNAAIEERACPYCGQLIMCEDGTDPRRLCRCADAVRFAAAEETLDDMETLLDELFGDGCDEISKSFIPVGEKEMSALNHVLVLVAGGLFAKANITLADGSVCTIKGDKVERKLTIKR